MFGEQKEIIVRIPYPTKEATLRLPSSQEVLTYLDSFGKKKKTDDDRQPDVDLFKKIRLDAGEEFDEYESAYVINNILMQSVTACDKVGDEYCVKIKTPFGETIHTLRLPSVRELVQYRKAVVSQDVKAGRNSQVKLYDALSQNTEGYAENIDVPILHKAAVVERIYAAFTELDPFQTDPNV